MVVIRSRRDITVGRDIQIAEGHSKIGGSPPPKKPHPIMDIIRKILAKFGVEI